MSRMPRAGGVYVAPVDVAASQALPVGVEPIQDVLVTPEAPHGKYTLVAGTTYVYPLGGPDAPFLSAHVQWDAAIIITSITVEDTNFGKADVTNFSTTAGDWINENPSTAFVGFVGAGVTVTNGVIAVIGGAAGGCMFHVAETGAIRSRLRVAVGATGGALRVGSHGKD